MGIAQGAMGFGGLAGGILAGAAADKLKIKNGYLTLVACSLAAFLMGISIFEAIPKDIGYIMITGASFGAMCASTMFSVSMLTAVQRNTPAHLLGKIMAVIIAVSSCSQPIGQAAYGILFDILADKPYVVMLAAAVAAMYISMRSKKIFVELDKTLL